MPVFEFAGKVWRDKPEFLREFYAAMEKYGVERVGGKTSVDGEKGIEGFCKEYGIKPQPFYASWSAFKKDPKNKFLLKQHENRFAEKMWSAQRKRTPHPKKAA